MRDLLPFTFDDYEVTAAVINDRPMFSANEVAIALGYRDYRHAIRTHCKRVAPSPVPLRDKRGQIQHPNLIPESDVYRLIFRSRLPSAERFADWVFEEVLPSIRKTGGYSLDDMTEHGRLIRERTTFESAEVVRENARLCLELREYQRRYGSLDCPED